MRLDALPPPATGNFLHQAASWPHCYPEPWRIGIFRPTAATLQGTLPALDWFRGRCSCGVPPSCSTGLGRTQRKADFLQPWEFLLWKDRRYISSYVEQQPCSHHRPWQQYHKLPGKRHNVQPINSHSRNR